MVICHPFGMLVTIMAAFPLAFDSKKFRFRNAYTWFFLFIMVFHGGIVPTYVVIQKIGLLNHFWVLILPVGHWNSWFDGMIYMNDPAKWPLATLLQTIVIVQDFNKTGFDEFTLDQISNRSVKAAQIFISILPILIVYPFMQRYFVKGLVIGSVKE